MMKLTAFLLGFMLLAAVVTAVVDISQTADGAKATKKSPRHSHTHNRGNQVCGDELCQGPSFIKKLR